MPQNRSALMIDGKAVRCWLFARLSKLSPHPVLYQVQAFDVDHAMRRLTQEIAPGFASRQFHLIEELDPEHDVGLMGTFHPLNPLAVASPKRLQ